MKEELCRAFCDSILVRDVPAGLAVGTHFRLNNGDALGFYVTYADPNKRSGRIEDDGLTIGSLEAAGINLSSGARADQFLALLDQFGITLDNDEIVLHTQTMPADQLPMAAIQFVAFMMRVQELTNWTRDAVEETFRDDVLETVRKHFAGKADLLFSKSASAVFPDFPVDVVIVPPEGLPLALFVGTSEAKGLEAMLLWSEITSHRIQDAKVMLIVDTARTKRVSERTYGRAINRFPVAVFSQHRDEAMASIERNVLGAGDHGSQAVH